MRVLKDFIEAANSTNFRMLDVEPLSSLRPDAHARADDCLHFNTPGVVDWQMVALMLDMTDKGWNA